MRGVTVDDRIMNKFATHAVLAAATVVAVWWGVPWLCANVLFAPGEDDNGLGVGLVTFAALAGAAGLLGLFSGLRLGWIALWIWPVLGLVLGVVDTAFLASEDGGFDGALFASDLTDTGLFIACLAIFPGLGGVFLGAIARPSGPPAP